jgi:hypothetical protein
MTAGVGAGVYHGAMPSFVSLPRRLHEQFGHYFSLLVLISITVPSFTQSVSHCGTTRKPAYQCIHPQRISPRQSTAVLSSVW